MNFELQIKDAFALCMVNKHKNMLNEKIDFYLRSDKGIAHFNTTDQYPHILKFEFEDEDDSGSSESSFEKKNPFGKGRGVRVGNDKKGGKTSSPIKTPNTKGKGKSTSEMFDTDVIMTVGSYYDGLKTKFVEKKNIISNLFDNLTLSQI